MGSDNVIEGHFGRSGKDGERPNEPWYEELDPTISEIDAVIDNLLSPTQLLAVPDITAEGVAPDEFDTIIMAAVSDLRASKERESKETPEDRRAELLRRLQAFRDLDPEQQEDARELIERLRTPDDAA